VNISFLTEKLPYSQICGTKVGTSYKKRRQSEIENLQKPNVFEIGIQTEQPTQSESDVIINLNQMIDYLNNQIGEIKLDHEKDMANLIVSIFIKKLKVTK